MREMYMEKIDKNIVEEVERNIRFVDPVGYNIIKLRD